MSASDQEIMDSMIRQREENRSAANQKIKELDQSLARLDSMLASISRSLRVARNELQKASTTLNGPI